MHTDEAFVDGNKILDNDTRASLIKLISSNPTNYLTSIAATNVVKSSFSGLKRFSYIPDINSCFVNYPFRFVPRIDTVGLRNVTHSTKFCILLIAPKSALVEKYKDLGRLVKYFNQTNNPRLEELKNLRFRDIVSGSEHYGIFLKRHIITSKFDYIIPIENLENVWGDYFPNTVLEYSPNRLPSKFIDQAYDLPLKDILDIGVDYNISENSFYTPELERTFVTNFADDIAIYEYLSSLL